MKHGLGLVIGKFNPPHRGHKLLIDAATAQSEQTVLIVCAKPTDSIPGELRLIRRLFKDWSWSPKEECN